VAPFFYFDGALVTRGIICGAGGNIKCRDSKEYRWYINYGAGTNIKVELLGAWASLFITKYLDIQFI